MTTYHECSTCLDVVALGEQCECAREQVDDSGEGEHTRDMTDSTPTKAMADTTTAAERVHMSRSYRSLGGGTFKRVTVGDVSIKLVALSTHGGVCEPVFMLQDWDTCEPVSQRERSCAPGSWPSESAAVARAVEYVYEHSAVASTAHRAAAGWLVATDWGRRN